MTEHLRAKGIPHGNKTQIKVALETETFERVSRMAYRHNVPVSAMLRQMITRQLEKVDA